MKIGFIFECGAEGPDVQVCRANRKSGTGQGIILISINKHPKDRYFQPQYRRFRGQNWPDKQPVVLEADMLSWPQRPFYPLL